MRAFLAIPLPEALLDAVAAAARALVPDGRDWRPARADGLHLTLRFLGEIEAGHVAALEGPVAVAARATPILDLAVQGAGAFPSPARPRILWAGIEERHPGSGLAALAACLEEAARGAGLEPETRPFFPHITLARARVERARLSALDAVGAIGTFAAAEVVLFQSSLGAGGAKYTVERRYAFGGAP